MSQNNETKTSAIAKNARTKPRAASLGSVQFREREMIASGQGNGVRLVDRMRESVSAPNIERRVAISVTSNIIDLFEGQTDTTLIWGEKTNKEFVTRLLTSAEGRESVMPEVATFLINRSMARVIEDLVKVPLFKPSDTLFTKSGLYAALVEHAPSRETAQVLMELVLPILINVGMVSPNGRYASQTKYGFERVEVAALSAEIGMLQAFSALDSVKIAALGRDNRQSKQVFGDTIAELLRPVGLALAQVPELSVVMDDITKCVRAYITPVGSVGSGDINVPTLWSTNPSIVELAGCLPFIRAALALPSGTTIHLSNDSASLESWLRLVIQMLRDTPRYQWTSRTEALRHYGVRKVRDLAGAPTSLIAHRSVKVDRVAQAVIATPDAILGDEAFTISATRDRIAETIQAAYGKSDLSTDAAANLLGYVTDNLVSMGYTGWTGAMLIDAWGNGLSVGDLAVLRSEKVYAIFNEGDNVVTVDGEGSGRFDPVWWFSNTTVERQLKVYSGRHLGDAVLTCDPVEAMLAMPDLDARDSLPARKQLIGPNAFNATVFGFDKDKDLQKLDDKFKFDIVVANTKMAGAFRPLDFASLRSVKLTRMVKPHFNARVVATLQEAYAVSVNFVENALSSAESEWHEGVKPGNAPLEQMLDVCATRLLQLSQTLSPTFREEVEEAVTERVLVSEAAKGEEGMILRAKLIQSYFRAYADLLSLLFFMHIQGMSAEVWQELVVSGRMERVCLMLGSDREGRVFV
jgi:hypothetical protein